MSQVVVWLRSLPGPVWTMALWCVIFLAATVEALAHGHQGVVNRGWIVTVPIAVLVTVLVWGARTPAWFLHLAVMALLGVSVFSMLNSDDAVQSVVTASSMMAAVIYSGLWWHGWTTYAYAVLIAAATLVAFSVAGMSPVLWDAWFTLTAMTFGVAFALNLVVSRGVHQATHDALTGLLNRVGLHQYLLVAGTAGRTTLPRCVVSIDLDGLKAINDTRGHAEGDRILRETAGAWRSVVRPDDVVVRMGGDEFLLILPKTTPRTAKPLLERMRAASPTPWSFGACDWPANGSFDQALHTADELMYQDKHRHARSDHHGRAPGV